MNENKGLVFAYILDGKGGGTAVDWKGIKKWHPDMGTLWIHVDYTNEEVKKWLHSDSNLNPLSCEILIEEDTAIDKSQDHRSPYTKKRKERAFL